MPLYACSYERPACFHQPKETLRGSLLLQKKVRGELFQDMDLREIQALVGTKLEELTEDDSIEMSALEPEPDEEEEDTEEAEPENKLTLDNLAMF